jgi:hypothetical protein
VAWHVVMPDALTGKAPIQASASDCSARVMDCNIEVLVARADESRYYAGFP